MNLIRKSYDHRVRSNMPDYDSTRSRFSWQDVEDELPHVTGGGLNIAYAACDSHLERSSERTALRCIDPHGERREYSFAELSLLSNQFANAMSELGLSKGERIFALLPRCIELYIAVLGALKNECIFSPLFSAFGSEPIKARMQIGKAAALVTTSKYFLRKLRPIRAALEDLKWVVIVGELDPRIEGLPGVVSFDDIVERASKKPPLLATKAEDPALIHFTSGTTGRPKGAVHVHAALLEHYITGKYALDLRADDIFWCTADPGWVTGMSYGIISPLINGVTTVVDAREFNLENWYSVLRDEKVTVWYTAPTAIRMMMTESQLAKKFSFDALRFIASVGEPLNPEAIRWGERVFGLPIHDNWWQTETGGIMIANYASMDIKPGSMGKPMPGITAAVLNQGTFSEARDDEVGELAIKAPWPSMFRDYLGEHERYEKCFTKQGWYLSGDLARVDADGYFWFVGRSDDIIKSAGHLIGPFEVESALLEHEAVAEAAVIGKSDPLLMEMVKAFISLNTRYQDSVELRENILGFARKKLGAAIAPREIEVVANLPKTRSGKIMRRLLKARECGLDEGDLSTLDKSLNKGGGQGRD